MAYLATRCFNIHWLESQLYALHFWLVSCYMIQHPSNFTKESYNLLVNLFKEVYDHEWPTEYILQK